MLPKGPPSIIAIIIIIATVIIKICIFLSYAQNVFFDIQKRGPMCPKLGGWGWGVICSKESILFLCEVFPKCSRGLSGLR